MNAWPSVLPDTASAAETVWTGATAIGTIAASFGAGITTSNLRAARKAAGRARAAVPVVPLHTAITDQAVRNEAISAATLVLLLVMLTLFVTVGVVSMATPEPVREELKLADQVVVVVLLVGAGLATVAAILLTLGSILNRRDRHRLTNRITGRLIREQLAARRARKSPEQQP